MNLYENAWCSCRVSNFVIPEWFMYKCVGHKKDVSTARSGSLPQKVIIWNFIKEHDVSVRSKILSFAERFKKYYASEESGPYHILEKSKKSFYIKPWKKYLPVYTTSVKKL
jgi:hypothetical protein